MITLHNAIDYSSRVFWFGMSQPCDDAYHNGYDHERTTMDQHHDCVRTITRRLGLEVIDRFYCVCPDCNVPNMAHYSYVLRGEPDPWADTGVVPRCEPCRNGAHPHPEPRPV